MLNDATESHIQLFQACAAEVNARAPKVHCLINQAAIELTANALLAVGAQPSMTDNPWEAQEFVESSSALNVNLGMLTESRQKAIRIAAKTASKLGIPWTLDPVMAERSQTRLAFCVDLLRYSPSVIRGNQDEISALCARKRETIEDLATRHDTVAVVTGDRNMIFCKEGTEVIKGGSIWMSRVTGMGCALSAALAAFLGACGGRDRIEAVKSALYLYGVAGMAAERKSEGPGSFASAFIDELHLQSSDCGSALDSRNGERA